MKIGILDPLNAAMRATGLILFRPFGVRKWLAIALPVWLIMIGQGMGTEYMQPAIWVGQWIGWEKIGNWIMAHMVLFDVYLFLGMLVAFAIYLAYRWLNALGELGLISRMLERESSMKQALGRHKRRAWTLCWFMVKWEFVVFNCGALLVLSCAALATPDVVHSWPGLKAHFFDLAVDPSLFFNE